MSTRFSWADIQRLKNNGLKIDIPKEEIKENFDLESTPAGKNFIEKTFKELGIEFDKEKKVVVNKELPNRKFRFDYYFSFSGNKYGVEYEGVFVEKNSDKQSRHTNVVGYTKDSTKYNLAAIQGIHVLRYTAMNYKEFESDLKYITKSER